MVRVRRRSNETEEQSDKGAMGEGAKGRGNDGIRVRWDRGAIRRGNNGTRVRWDGGAMGRGNNGI